MAATAPGRAVPSLSSSAAHHGASEGSGGLWVTHFWADAANPLCLWWELVWTHLALSHVPVNILPSRQE